MDDQQTLQNDIAQIDALLANLEQENTDLANVAEEVRKKIEEEAGPEIQGLAEDSAHMAELEKKAEEDERQGNIADVQGQIQSM